MALTIDNFHLELIHTYGEGAYPNECCGFLLGRQNNGQKEVLSTLPAFNAREQEERYHRFLITPEAYLQAERLAKSKALDIVGFYHSHPNAAARPSQFDLQHGWPWYSYVIVSVLDEKAQAITSWVLEDDRSKFKQEEIIVKTIEENDNQQEGNYVHHRIDSNSAASVR